MVWFIVAIIGSLSGMDPLSSVRCGDYVERICSALSGGRGWVSHREEGTA